MKKLIYLMIFVLLLFPFSLNALCADEEDFYESTQDKLFSVIDDDTSEALEQFGITSIDYAGIYDVSLSSLLSYFSSDLNEKLTEVFKSFLIMTCMIIILSTAKALNTGSSGESGIEMIAVMAVTLVCINTLGGTVNTVISVLSLSGKFMLGYIPVFAGIIALGGNPAAALTYNTVALAAAEGISVFSNGIAVNAVGCYFSLVSAFSMNESINLSRFVNAFNRISSIVLGLLSGVFSAILSIKGVLSASVDSVSTKGIRFLISNFIPVVGSAISDAYSTLLGSIHILKGSVAFIGIIATIVMNFPAICEALMYFVSLSILSVFAEISECGAISTLFKGFAAGIKILLLLVVFEVFIFIISTGLMLNLKTGA